MKAFGKPSIVISVLALSLTLVGCGPTPTPGETAGGEPGASASAMPSEAPPADPRDSIASIMIDGDSVSITTSDGGTYLDIPFTTDPEEAVDQLNEALRSSATRRMIPVVPNCFGERPEASWGGLTFTWGDDWQRPTDAKFIAEAKAAATAGGIAIAMPGGQHVGDSESAVLVGAPGSHVESIGTTNVIHFDVANGSPVLADFDVYWGALAVTTSGTLVSFASPVMYFYDC